MYTTDAQLLRHLPPEAETSPDAILNGFLRYVAEQEVELYPAQEEAILELVAGKNVILNTPTGSGKSLVASAFIFKALAEGKTAVYTCPIKALVSEKFFALCREFGAEHVGMLTGDASVNRNAPVLCCTAEILANMALRYGDALPVDHAVIDEFHYYADRERGVAWQLPLLTMPRTAFLLMSATMGDSERFAKGLTALNGRETAVVRSGERPVPLDFEYRETPLHETILDLVKTGRSPIYVVNFTQRAAAEEAQNLMSTDYCTKDEKRAIAEALAGFRFDSPYGKDVQRYLRHGVGLHHAGLLPKYRLLTEKLAQRGLLKVICGTDTLGVGVNIPIRTVLFTKLFKFDGEKLGVLSVRDFQQISGRAGRKGFDDRGTVVAQAPEHVVENLRLEAKAGDDPAKRRKIVRKKPPERGYVHWDRATFERLVKSAPEPLVSRFQVSHGMLLNVLSRPEGGCRAMKDIVRSCHEGPTSKKRHGKTARLLFRSLVEAGVVELRPYAEGGLRVNVDLQSEFSLNQSLSLYLLDTLPRLDAQSPDYALDLLTLVESILEDPDLILSKQLDRLKTEKLAELKAAGVEYDERMAELERLEYPKPNREFIYETFNAFAAQHPWVGHENIRPKSVAREMYETYQTFPEYVKEYGLQRSEGLLLRYVSDVYKALAQTVPDPAKTADVFDMIAYFGTLVRGVDSSLLDEWESLRNVVRATEAPAAGDAAPDCGSPTPHDLVADRRGFTALVRGEIFRFLRAIASRDFETASALVRAERGPWPPADLERLAAAYFEEYPGLPVDPAARHPRLTRITEADGLWHVEQTIDDPEHNHDWVAEFVVDLDLARAEGAPSLVLRRFGSHAVGRPTDDAEDADGAPPARPAGGNEGGGAPATAGDQVRADAPAAGDGGVGALAPPRPGRAGSDAPGRAQCVPRQVEHAQRAQRRRLAERPRPLDAEVVAPESQGFEVGPMSRRGQRPRPFGPQEVRPDVPSPPRTGPSGQRAPPAPTSPRARSSARRARWRAPAGARDQSAPRLR
jgi:superfamily II DNA/RNA helicase